MSTQRTLYQSAASNDLATSERKPSSFTRSTHSTKGHPILGDISVQVWNRRDDFTRGTSLWYATFSLPGHAKNALSAPDVCDLSQLGTCLSLAGRATTRSNPHFSLRRLSFGRLSVEVRQQYQSAYDPLDSRDLQMVDLINLALFGHPAVLAI
jgi:hypothetical protein